MQGRLRLGIMCEGPVFQRWQAMAIRRMLDTGLVELALVIVDDPANVPPMGRWAKVRRLGFARLLFRLYHMLLFRPQSLILENLSALLEGVPTIRCIVDRRGRWSQYFSASDVEAVRRQNLDMVLRFGFSIIRGDILSAARHGVWSFHHDDELRYRGGPPAFWEIALGDPETGAILQRLTDRLDGGIVLKKGIFRTKSYSYARNLDQSYFESAKWPAWVCRDIAMGSAPYLDAPPTPTDAPIYRAPTNGRFLLALLRSGLEAVRQARFRLFTLQRWNVALLRLPAERLLAATVGDLRAALGPPLTLTGERSFNADCFGLPHVGGSAVLFEHLDYGRGGVGELAGVFLDGAGVELSRFKPYGLPEGNHVSYPYLLRDKEEIYAVPETSSDGCVMLYRADKFPHSWSAVAVLLAGEAFVDPTLIRHDGRYWLFYTVNSEEYNGDLHLHIAFADQIDGPYAPHPGNPVKISARSARPAGTPFLTAAGELIRPAQNFCRTYGGSIVFNRVNLLTPTRFEEEEVGELSPFDLRFPDGLHTLSVIDDDTCLVDMKRHVFNWRPL